MLAKDQEEEIEVLLIANNTKSASPSRKKIATTRRNSQRNSEKGCKGLTIKSILEGELMRNRQNDVAHGITNKGDYHSKGTSYRHAKIVFKTFKQWRNPEGRQGSCMPGQKMKLQTC